mmetsp:Transcript_40561/g.115618  ORF Transcript_40561/g.115618 Transcript_40561/m.115618 type:complete len:225 (+) Transcript_40561:1673-2347(+)
MQVCLVEHDLQAVLQVLDVLETLHLVKEVLETGTRLGSVQQVTATHLQQVHCHFCVVRREVLDEAVEVVHHDPRRTHATLAQLAQVTHILHLALQVDRVLCGGVFREVGPQFLDHTLPHLLAVGRDGGHQTGEEGQQRQIHTVRVRQHLCDFVPVALGAEVEELHGEVVDGLPLLDGLDLVEVGGDLALVPLAHLLEVEPLPLAVGARRGAAGAGAAGLGGGCC